MTDHDHHLDDDQQPTLEESRAIIAEQERTVRSTMTVDDRLVYAVWGVAWGVGYLAMFLDAGTEGQPGVAGAITFGVLLAAAIAATIWHIEGRTRGTGGPESRNNWMLGAAWPISFIGAGFTAGAIGAAGIEGPATGIVFNAIPCLVVACLYMGTGAALNDRRQFLLGGWIAILVAGASHLGTPDLYLAMSVLGGGGFLATAVLAERGRRRSAR